MTYFFKKIFNKFQVYFVYYLNKNTRDFFFILIKRKFLRLLDINKNDKIKNKYINSWCESKKISEENFYRKIGIKNHKNFFHEKKAFYNSAINKQKKIGFKMGGMAHLNLIYNLTIHLKPKNILETGVAFGWSTLVFVLSKRNFSKLTSLDLDYPSMSSHKFVGRALPSNLRTKFKLLKGVDYKFLKNFSEEKKYFDFIHYDSDKSYDGRKKNYNLIWKILKKKGCFISDDISDNSAFYEFVNSNKAKYYIIKLEKKFIGILFK